MSFIRAHVLPLYQQCQTESAAHPITSSESSQLLHPCLSCQSSPSLHVSSQIVLGILELGLKALRVPMYDDGIQLTPATTARCSCVTASGLDYL